MEPGIWKQTGAILAVFLLLGLTLFLMRSGVRRQLRPATRGGRKLHSLERLMLTPNHSLHLVRTGEKVMLLAVHPGGINLLSESELLSQAARSEEAVA